MSSMFSSSLEQSKRSKRTPNWRMCKGKTDLSLWLGDTPVSPRAFEFVAWRHPCQSTPCTRRLQVAGVTWKGRRWRFEGRRRACRVAGRVYLTHRGGGTP